MANEFETIGFIGGGNMGEAMLGALIRKGLFGADRIRVSDVSDDRRAYLADTYGVSVTTDNAALFTESDLVILSVKPQHMTEVLEGIVNAPDYAISRRKLVISIAAGVRISVIESILYGPLAEDARKRLPVIRVMPNTPALVGAGISGMSPNAHAGSEDLDVCRNILAAMGQVVDFDESDLDAVTALSGSGPAYVFYFIEALTAAGVEVGLSRGKSETLAVATVNGAVKLLMERAETPENLRRKVTSPGGTTEAALKVLMENRFMDHITAAIRAATERGRELSR